MKPPKIEVTYSPDQAERIAQMEGKLARLSAEANALDADRRALATADPSTMPRPTDPSAVRIAELLGEKPPEIVPDQRTRLAEMAQRSRLLREATNLLSEKIRVERMKASAEARARLAPEYRLRIRAICDAFRGVHTANLHLRELTSAMEDADISWNALGDVGLLGRPTDPYSLVGLYLKNAADLGFIGGDEIPPELRQ